MKELLALLIFIALLVFGWNQSYREHYVRIFPTSAVAKQHRAERAAQRQNIAQVPKNALPATQDSAWMWSPTRLSGKRAEENK